MTFGSAIQLKRQEKGFSVPDMAYELNIPNGILEYIEKDEYKPDAELITKISELIDVPVQVLKYLSIREQDVNEEKRRAFKILQPSIEAMIEKLFFKPA